MSPGIPLSLLVCSLLLFPAPGRTDGGGEGVVNLSMKIYSSTYHRLLDEPLTEAHKREMVAMYDRLIAFSPSFDRHLAWFPNAWEYEDLYRISTSVGPGDAMWNHVLKDRNGSPLYIDFDCDSSPPCGCPQRAGDFGDQAFRDHWIERTRNQLEQGYRGLFIDDIDLYHINTSDECGNTVLPVDERTGTVMSLADQQRYMAEFSEQIRAAFPEIEIVHNAIFAARPADRPPPGEPSALERQLMTADIINLETGAPVKDGGDHPFGFETWLAFVDGWHARGKHFVVQDDKSVEDDDGEVPPVNADELQALRYQLAAYYLINDGFDFLSADGDAQQYRAHPSFFAPNAYSTDYRHDLGTAEGKHYRWKDLFRRDFTCGIVVLNQPEQPSRTVSLEREYIDLDGRRVRSLTLPAVSGAVLRTECAVTR